MPTDGLFAETEKMIPYKELKTSKKFPFITLLIIGINIALFTYMLILPLKETDAFVYRYAAIPLEFRLGHNLSISPGVEPIFTVFTAMFMHGGWFHIIGNMLYLWIFGASVEGNIGHWRFFIFYMMCGFLATFAQIYTNFDSRIPLLGASGAIAGVLAAYLRLFPKAKIAVLIPIFYFLRKFILPAWVVLTFWIVMQIVEVQMTPATESGGVAYFAHIGGFISGFLFLPVFQKNRRRR